MVEYMLLMKTAMSDGESRQTMKLDHPAHALMVMFTLDLVIKLSIK